MKTDYQWRFTGGAAFVHIEESLTGYTGAAQLFLGGVDKGLWTADDIRIPSEWKTEDKALSDLCYLLYLQASIIPVENRMEYMRVISCGKDSAIGTGKDFVHNPVKDLVEELEEFRDILHESAAEISGQLNLFG